MSQPKPWVLVVEHDPRSVALSLEALEDSGQRATVIPDAAEALGCPRWEGKYRGVSRPEMLLLELPALGDEKLLQGMKNDPALSEIPVVALVRQLGRWRWAATSYPFLCQLVEVTGDDPKFGMRLRGGIQEAWRWIKIRRREGGPSGMSS